MDLTPPFRVDREGPVATVTLARPERRNPLSLALMRALHDQLGRIGADADLRVIVLGAEGPAFCAGHDLREMVGREPGFYEELFGACGELMMALHRLPQPVIARVQGIATAAGCQLVAACDLAIASEDARFATPGVRIGLFCSTPMVEVARAIAPKRAMEMLLTGEPIDAATALAWGLVNRVVAPAALDSACAEWAAAIAQASGAALAIGKRAYHDATGPSAAAYAVASAAMCRNMAARDAQEGITAFLDRRTPQWVHG